MWVFFSDNINRNAQCECIAILSAQDRGEGHDCHECRRSWQWINCDWWTNYAKGKKAPLLGGAYPWDVNLVEVANCGRAIRKYLARHQNGAAVLLDSVSNVLDTLGAGEPLIHWKLMETCLAMAQPWLPSIDVRPLMKADNGKGKMVTRRSFAEVVRELSPPAQGAKVELSLAELIPTFDDAIIAHRRTSTKAAEYGTRAHELVDLWKKRGGTWDYEIDGIVMTTPIDEEEAPVRNCIAAFLRFWDREKLRFLHSEITVYDILGGIAGTLDALVDVAPAGDLVVLDWKTSGAAYEKFFLQVAAYCRMYERMGLGRISRAYIIRMDKETAALQIVPVFLSGQEYREACQDFGAILRLHRWTNRISNHIKKYPTEKPPALAGKAPDDAMQAIVEEGEAALAAASS